MFSSAVSSNIFCSCSAPLLRRSIVATDSEMTRMTTASAATRNDSVVGDICNPSNTSVGSGISVTAPIPVK